MKHKKNTQHEDLYNDFLYTSYGLIGLRLAFKSAFSVVKEVASNLGSAIASLNISQLGIYGIYSALFTITDAIKLRNLWKEEGQYAHKKLSLFKKVKTTVYTVSSRLFSLGFYAVTLLMTLAVLSISAPISIGFMAAFSLNGIFRYGHSLARAFVRDDALNPNNPDYDEQQKAATYKIRNASVKLALAVLIAVILTTSIVLSGPFAPIVTGALWAVWGISNLVYNAVIKPRMKARLYPKSIQPTTFIELKPITSSKFKAPETSLKAHSVDLCARVRERTSQPLSRRLQPQRG